MAKHSSLSKQSSPSKQSSLSKQSSSSKQSSPTKQSSLSKQSKPDLHSPSSGISFGILVGKTRSEAFKDGLGSEVFRRN